MILNIIWTTFFLCVSIVFDRTWSECDCRRCFIRWWNV